MRRSPSLAVDIIILIGNKLVLIKRENEPFKDCFAIPGGFVEYGETVETAAIREAKEETGLDVKNLSFFRVYSDPDRDPRGHTISIVFNGEGKGIPKAGDDARELYLFDLDKIPDNLAFDHNKIIQDFFEKYKVG
ncbi:MAG: ADP-ribose pyrophosphatase [Candidatus Methanofastidiosum methylothiophilum]|uniref:ADP-ribose pyrophosphatase n=1 Tax=Candidatus Methanofastidiosum methylothiophilum TaxID=1705564 RepID=A0A150IKP4_9EURY|nr:MAG: ADP-ribose pyrophosphatase [Candidatus Methanofastidiosum methylthiophilus]KYC47210.1 MAG: ADP-ribose pyrophosphatase [Candidatus Methanofastidiosum methylthiophilus]KYC51447.1 MAG: ADP-ribose pyrophosphatase [Candidatus Methanofastidiosum methylthiophilus]